MHGQHYLSVDADADSVGISCMVICTPNCTPYKILWKYKSKKKEGREGK